MGGNRQRPARTDDVCTYIEYCKQKQQSIYASKIQNLLLENHVCLPQNVPSQSSISCCLKSDLGYSYKKLKIIARESLTVPARHLLEPYHPEYNTCEMCFRYLKGFLRKFSQLAEEHTEIAIFHGLSKITQSMSRNFFKYCGYIVSTLYLQLPQELYGRRLSTHGWI